MKQSEKIKYLIDLRRMPRLSPRQALEVWKITNKLLPQDCLWRDDDAISIELLEIIAYCYFCQRGKTTSLEEVCLACIQTYNKPCKYRSRYLH